MDPSVRGVLKADDRGSAKFDVTRGIPTSEDLYANVLAKEYLFQHRWVNMTGTVTYTVKVKGFIIKPGRSREEPLVVRVIQGHLLSPENVMCPGIKLCK